MTTFCHGNFFVVCFCCELVVSSFWEEVGSLVEMVVYQMCFMNGVAINRTIKKITVSTWFLGSLNCKLIYFEERDTPLNLGFCILCPQLTQSTGTVLSVGCSLLHQNSPDFHWKLNTRTNGWILAEKLRSFLWWPFYRPFC